MNSKRNLILVILGLVFTTLSYGQTSKSATEYLGVAGPILFDKDSYSLTWSSHPADNYYKQEYLAKGDSIAKFKKLLLLEVLTGKTKLKDIVAAKIAELKKMKESNPVVNFEMLEKDGEIILDFLLSENTPDGKYLTIVERNVYRYKSVAEKNGQKCVQLFGVSERAYGDDIDIFFQHLKEHRFDLINSVGAFAIPDISIAK